MPYISLKKKNIEILSTGNNNYNENGDNNNNNKGHLGLKFDRIVQICCLYISSIRIISLSFFPIHKYVCVQTNLNNNLSNLYLSIYFFAIFTLIRMVDQAKFVRWNDDYDHQVFFSSYSCLSFHTIKLGSIYDSISVCVCVCVWDKKSEKFFSFTRSQNKFHSQVFFSLSLSCFLRIMIVIVLFDVMNDEDKVSFSKKKQIYYEIFWNLSGIDWKICAWKIFKMIIIISGRKNHFEVRNVQTSYIFIIQT